MNFIGIIPARYSSKRLRGKPLMDICGKSMIQRVYEQSVKALEYVFVATDDDRIVQHVKDFGGNALMTSSKHQSGTDRCLEALEIICKTHKKPIDVIINIQGDEPLLVPQQIENLKQCFEDKSTELATLAVPVSNSKDLYDDTEVFVTFNIYHNALYFSRSVIPYVARTDKTSWMKKTTFYKHLGIYAYTKESLRKFANLPQSHLEIVESLEQNRWIAHGYPIKIGITKYDMTGVDTLENLEKVREIFKTLNLY